MAKILLIVAIIVSLVTAGLGYLNKQKLDETTAELATTTSSLTSTRADLAAKTKSLEETTTALETANAEKATLETSLATANTAKETAEKKIAELEPQISAKDTEIATLNDTVTEKDRIIKELTDATPTDGGTDAPDATVDTNRLAELEALVSSLETKNAELRTNLDTMETKEKDRQAKIMQDGLEGQVLAVNPAWNFVVLSIGDNRGVVNNAELLLKRNGRYLGKVRVTSVEPSTSIADIVANSLPTGVAVQPGDQVIYQSSKN